MAKDFDASNIATRDATANTQAEADTPEYFGQAYAAFNAAAIKSVNGRVLNIKSALMAFHDAALEAALAAREGADTARLDYIERTFSGMTNCERYLPVRMRWGKGCNGRTLREACDKYMKRDAAAEQATDGSEA